MILELRIREIRKEVREVEAKIKTASPRKKNILQGKLETLGLEYQELLLAWQLKETLNNYKEYSMDTKTEKKEKPATTSITTKGKDTYHPVYTDVHGAPELPCSCHP